MKKKNAARQARKIRNAPSRLSVLPGITGLVIGLCLRFGSGAGGTSRLARFRDVGGVRFDRDDPQPAPHVRCAW
jgi:hypothetical protein